jgi:hypothetical protein
MFFHLDHVEQPEIFQVNNHKLSLIIKLHLKKKHFNSKKTKHTTNNSTSICKI